MADDVWDHPETEAWMRDVREGLLPQLRASVVTGALITTSEPDVKQAVELGMTLLLGKPLVLLVTPGASVPDGLAAAAVAILKYDPADPESGQRVSQTIAGMIGDE